MDYILRRTGIDKYTCELGAPQPFQLFHGALEQAHLRIFRQFCSPTLQVRPDCAPKILLKTALLCSLGHIDITMDFHIDITYGFSFYMDMLCYTEHCDLSLLTVHRDGMKLYTCDLQNILY